jgi:integrase/recombinase XerD
MTLENAVNEFLTNITIEKNLSQNTIISYKRDLSAFGLFIGKNTNIDKITLKNIEEFIKSLKDKKQQESSIIRNVSAIKGLFKFLIDEDIIDFNPTLDLQKIKMPSRLPKALSIEQIFKIIENVNGAQKTDLRNRALLELLYATGARVSEIANLQLEDIDWDEEYVKLFGKGSKTRVVPVGKKALIEVKNYITNGRWQFLKKNKPLKNVLFVNAYGEKMSRYSIYNVIKEAAKKVNLEKVISPHTFRHSFATHLILGGADTRIVQELLGHESLSTTQIYTKITVDHLREVYALSHPRA